MNKKNWLVWLCILTTTLFTFNVGCKKPLDPKVTPQKLSSEIDLKKFSFDEILSKLPQSILYNLGDRAKFYTNEAETQEYSDGTKVLRFPISADRSRYLYAIRTANPNDALKVYLRHIISSSGSYETDDYTAVEDVIDVESWTIYRQEFSNNQLSKYYDEVVALTPGWEQCAIQNHELIINDDGLIDENPNPPLTAQRGPYDCPPNPNKGPGWIKRVFARIGEFFGDLVSGGDGMVNDGIFYPSYTGSGGYSVPSSGGGGTSGGGGGSNAGNPRLGDSYFNQPHTAPGFENEGGDFIWLTQTTALNNDPTIPSYFRDENGYIYSRKTALEVYVSEKPFGLIDCDDIQLLELHLSSIRNIAAYTPPQSVQDHIDAVINANSPYYNSGNTYIKYIEEGRGVVNLDLFPVHIQQLPKNANGVTMTPLEFLEYFRKNFSHPNIPANGAVFTPFYDYVAGSINVDETNLFNNAGVGALGSIVHIAMFPDDGTVVLSDYYINTNTDSYWFTFSTMNTRFDMDGSHPVAGNRRFGIQKQLDGTWNFYISGADRAWGFGIALANQLLSNYAGFHAADQVWTSIQNSVINYVNTNQGAASFYPIQSYALRARWLQIGNYLMGNQTLAELKAQLGCQ